MPWKRGKDVEERALLDEALKQAAQRAQTAHETLIDNLKDLEDVFNGVGSSHEKVTKK